MSSPGAPPGRAPSEPKDWTFANVYALVFLTLVSTLNYWDRSVLSLMLPLIKKDIHASDTVFGLVLAAIAIYSLVGVPVAWLAERWSRRNVIAIGLFFWSLMTGLTGLVTSVWQLAGTRVAMAIGESAGLAPSQSILSNIFSARARPLVLSVITTASSLALLIYSPVASWIVAIPAKALGVFAPFHGWRIVFFAAGAPGVLLALIMLLTIREPRHRAGVDPVRTAPIGEALAFLFGSKAFLWCLLGTSIMGVYLYGVSAWDASFLNRVRHFTVPQIGQIFQPIRGGVSAAGILLGGFLAARLEAIDARWRCWIPGLACVLMAPFQFVYLFADSTPVWVSAYAAAALFSIMHQGPIYAVYVSVAQAKSRAVAVSVALLGATVVGQIGGPVLIGWLNDALRVRFGDEGIRYSMLVVMACAFLAGLCYLAAARHLVADTRRAAEA
jgi:MFS family permease